MTPATNTSAEQGSERPILHTYIDYEDAYVTPLLASSLQRLPFTLLPLASPTALPSPTTPCLVWAQYESLPFSQLPSHPSLLINSYVFRKALIRKHYLATVVRNWLTKHPSSILGQHVKPGVDFEVDYAEFLDDALVECYELVDAMGRNEDLPAGEREWWILKAGMGERGNGIRLFSTMGELQTIFEGWDPDSDGEEDEDGGEGLVTSHMRHFVAQPYVHPPLLLGRGEAAGRKWHVRTYVLAVGAVKVYVYRRMLALFAGERYDEPGEEEDPNDALSGHLTNTCRQTGEREGSVSEFWAIPEDATDLQEGWKEKVFEQICQTTGEVFEAAARGMMMHFQPLPNAFEIYGLDFLVDATGKAWLLEVNAFPDFAQTGKDLSSLIAGLFDGVVDVAVKPFFTDGSSAAASASSDLVKVLDIDLGKR
ncbi:TTL-domain-containing protein [Myriangium duriaei CBS 260.36]|uniref:TTL-domain-containing protein n=1 Tax=Myriangium duriaei CBS 260.36 TaxID=1168546 RepID=A0A9P4MGL0_9PEZI|nr:TTL-domain-containing protein [Myriangium duriaei CBS 260.36]